MSGVTFESLQRRGRLDSSDFLQDCLSPLKIEVSTQVDLDETLGGDGWSHSHSQSGQAGRLPSTSEEQENQEEGGETSMLEYYLQSATIHGIAQTSGPQHYSLRRPIWLVLIVAMALGLGWTLFNQITHLHKYPIKTVTQVTLKNELPFPAVTICNLNQYIRERVPDIPLVKEILFRQSEYSAMSRHIRNRTELLDLENVTDISGEDLSRIAQNAAPRFDDIFLFCQWSFHNYSCADLFRPILTGYGTCYVFNGPEVKTHQRLAAKGLVSKLRILLSIQNAHSYYSRVLHAGIKILIHQPEEMPFPGSTGWFVRPGVAASMALSRTDSKGLPKPFKAFSNAYCEDTKAEGYINRLKFHSTYSEQHCVHENVKTKLEVSCGCRHYFSAYQENLPLCSAKQILFCYLGKASLVNTSVTRCARECESLDYTADMSYASIASGFAEEQAVRDGIAPSVQALRDSLIDLQIFFKTLNVMEIVQEPATSLNTIIGNLGGQMGLFLGASILSVTELVEVLLLLLVRAVKRCGAWATCRSRVEPSPAKDSA